MRPIPGPPGIGGRAFVEGWRSGVSSYVKLGSFSHYVENLKAFGKTFEDLQVGKLVHAVRRVSGLKFTADMPI